ncbi:MAG: S-adenosylmethionine:tRNA ribosyltransferase-isomerase [Bacteroidales bacterium]|nr:S-adenosylmethionine:tRNA ribosyltransferase-isomerase [Bacteroidales bacterium]
MNTIDKVRNIRISDYNYPLPDHRIAKHPLAAREQCKLLCYKVGGEISEGHFYDVPAVLPEKAMLVYNNTRVINARLRFRKSTGSTIEIFCLEPVAPCDYQLIFQTTQSCTWLCLVGNSKRWKQGPLTQEIEVDGKTVTLEANRGERRGNSFEIEFSWNGDVTFASILEAIGEIPIPPYLNRGTESTDSADYQTVYSHIDGSVAAPTAGLHFTDEVLAECDKRGITRRELTLHVGAGTFQPVKSENIGEHEMHHEFISVQRSLLVDLINAEGPVVAVGTTSVRTLESLYYVGQVLETNPDADEEMLTVKQWMPYSTPCEISTKKALQNVVDYLDRHHAEAYMGSTQLMIAPGFQYRIISGMITNFHQPQSTLLLLVSAFVGVDHWRAIYDYALDHDFRFLSYGDACFFQK